MGGGEYYYRDAIEGILAIILVNLQFLYDFAEYRKKCGFVECFSLSYEAPHLTG